MTEGSREIVYVVQEQFVNARDWTDIETFTDRLQAHSAAAKLRKGLAAVPVQRVAVRVIRRTDEEDVWQQ